ncbi:MAG: rhodanese-like domain-containing protein [Saprospiraceae bacterium]|nr:rhodanese-like domain-containing protein [Saprospiraceae bacterium]
MKHISYAELQQWQKENKDIQLIDVRQPFEHAEYHIGGDLIPLGEILQRMDEIDSSKTLVFYCKRGVRSQLAIQRLSDHFPDTEMYNLTGGVYGLKP